MAQSECEKICVPALINTLSLIGVIRTEATHCGLTGFCFKFQDMMNRLSWQYYDSMKLQSRIQISISCISWLFLCF